MKTKYSFLLIFFFVVRLWAADAISIEDFKKLSFQEREKVIESSSPEQREELSRISAQLLMKENFIRLQGEDAWKQHEEQRALTARGFEGYVFGIFNLQNQLWEYYVGQSMLLDEKAGMSKQGLIAAEKTLTAERDAVDARNWKTIEPLVVSLAPTPKALALEKKAKALFIDWQKYLHGNNPQPLSSETMKTVDQEAAEIADQVKRLPHLTPEQVQAEVNALPDEEPHR